MYNTQASITATFSAQDCTLIISGHSPNIKHAPQRKALVDYLSFLSADGWRVTQAFFEGFTINLDLEKADAASYPTSSIPIYLFHSFFVSFYGLSSGLPPGTHPSSPAALPGSDLSLRHLDNAARDQKALSKKLKETIRADGWQELCTSNLLSTTGYWILSLWMREAPG